MAIQLIDTTINAIRSDSITVDKPSGADGDLFVATAVIFGLPSVTQPSGWTWKALRSDSDVHERKQVVWYKEVSNYASEPAQYTWDFSFYCPAAVGIYCIRGYDTLDIFGSESFVNDDTPESTVTCGAATPDAAQSLIINAGGLVSTGTFSPNYTAPAGWTLDNQDYVYTVLNGDSSLFLGHKLVTGTGEVTGGDWPHNEGDNADCDVAYGLAVNAASSKTILRAMVLS